jgi:UDP-N-acetylglucosamine 2-epimerase (non-hydrolysing)
MRERTERPEGIQSGTVRLVGTDVAIIQGTVRTLLTDSEEYERMARAENPYGDGRAAHRIVAAIAAFFGNRDCLR